MSKTLFAVNTLTAIGTQAYASHLNLMYRIGKDAGDDCILYNGYRLAIDRFRNSAAKIAMDNGCDYILFLDDDICVPRNTYDLLKEANKDIITPLVYIRGYPFNVMMFKGVMVNEQFGLDFYNDWQGKTDERGLLECAAVGCSCMLVKVSLLRETQKFHGVNVPLFHTGVNYTEDIYFCMKAREATQNRASIFVATTIHAGHILDPEMIALESREGLLKFYEDLDPNLRRTPMNDNHPSLVINNMAEAANAPLSPLNTLIGAK